MKPRKQVCLPCITRRIRMQLGSFYIKGIEAAVVEYYWEKFPDNVGVRLGIIDYDDFVKSDFYINYGTRLPK